MPKSRREYHKNYMRKYNQTPKGKEVAAHSYRNRLKRCAELIKALKDIPCADCKMKYPSYVMDFDHLDPAQKKALVSQCTTETKILEEASKCEVVCANCHRVRTHKKELDNEGRNRSDEAGVEGEGVPD